MIEGVIHNDNRMIRSDLIARLAELHPQLQTKDAELAVKVIVDALCSTLSKGGRVEIRGFGSFGLNCKPSRKGRNPKTGVKVQVPARYVPHFKAGKEMRERVNHD
jgi:integration host factor subunit beta